MISKTLKYLILTVAFSLIQATVIAEEIVLTTLSSGKIAVKKPGAEKYASIKEGDVIEVGSWIMTLSKTDATLTFYITDKKTGDSNSTLQIGSYSKIKIDTFDAAKEKVTTEIKARAGHIISSVDHEGSKGNDYKVETPQITAAVKGTELELVVNSKITKVTTYRGQVTASSEYGEQYVDEGQLIEVNEIEMTFSIDSILNHAQNAVLFTGSSPAEAAFQNNLSLVPLGGNSTGQSPDQAFQSSNNNSQTSSASSFDPVCWEFIEVMPFLFLPFPIVPEPPHCDPLPPPPPPPGP